jgi:hypothetical protein
VFVISLLAAGWLAPSAPAAAAMVPAVDRSSTVAPDEATAAWQAHKFGSPVEVLADRTESSQTFAQPDGTFTFRQSASPQRVRKGESWVPVDTTLVLSGGSVVPKATVLAMRFRVAVARRWWLSARLAAKSRCPGHRRCRRPAFRVTRRPISTFSPGWICG